MAGGPCGLEVEAASNAVDVEDFACEEETRLGLAFHGFEIEVSEVDAAAGDEFVFVRAFSGDLKLCAGQLMNEVLGLLLGKVGPSLAIGDVGGLAEAGPEAAGDSFDEGALDDGARGVVFAFGAEDGCYFLGAEGAGPVDGEGEAVIAVGKVASVPGG